MNPVRGHTVYSSRRKILNNFMLKVFIINNILRKSKDFLPLTG